MADNAPGLEKKTLAEWRRIRGFTQMTLASEAGLTLGTIWNIEHGRNRPSFDTIQAIAKALNVLADQILWPNVQRFPSRANRAKKILPTAA